MSKWAAMALIVGVACVGTARAAQPAVPQLRLYVLDCGHASFKDMDMFSDTGEYSGMSGKIADPCFLIRHPKGTLLWDTGLGDKFAAQPAGVDAIPGVHVTVPITLVDQLKSLGMAPADVNFVAFSHFHFDHTGNANEFPHSVWIINQNELKAALATPTPPGIQPDTFSGYKSAKTQMINGDLDVFGDGTVRILSAPGHTPGHQVMAVRLTKAGTVILSGDLYHLKDNRQFKRVPLVNTNRADTLASMDRIERIVERTHARLIVQHDPEEFDALPKPPAYLE
ncbi:MAG: N-acyl homoserine lactone hydrolase [Gammaproteobacteria bacterium]|jgi:N-acyl homoserine lactone hydrolase|nr:N-acyl homoserine lactone hydrolase [Gammaproteobacteria bacterium]